MTLTLWTRHNKLCQKSVLFSIIRYLDLNLSQLIFKYLNTFSFFHFLHFLLHSIQKDDAYPSYHWAWGKGTAWTGHHRDKQDKQAYTGSILESSINITYITTTASCSPIQYLTKEIWGNRRNNLSLHRKLQYITIQKEIYVRKLIISTFNLLISHKYILLK